MNIRVVGLAFAAVAIVLSLATVASAVHAGEQQEDEGEAGGGGEGAALMRIVAPEETVDGGRFGVDVAIEGVENLGAFSFALRFDRELLEPRDVLAGPFLSSSGNETQCVRQEERTPPNEVWYGCFTIGTATGPNGAGVLATVEFDVVGDGESPLSFVPDLTRIVSPDAEILELQAQDASVTVEGGGGGVTLWLIIVIVAVVVVVIAAGAMYGFRTMRNRAVTAE